MGQSVKRFVCLLFAFCSVSTQASLKVAVASNFKVPLEAIASLYQQQYDQQIVISSGSTGTLYHQIKQGAPYDLFLSADSQRAKLIEQSSVGIKGSRFSYAQGQIAFWFPQHEGDVDESTLLNFKGRMAIANPKLAPYGLASQQALQHVKRWSTFSYIKGTNISQAYQFIDTGNIRAGFVAYSLLLQKGESHYYLIPSQYYPAILQQGVMLSHSKNKIALQHFVDFLQSSAIQQLIRSKGYL